MRKKEKWPKDLYGALFITHRLFLDFGSLLHPLAGGRRAGVGMGQDQQVREHEIQQEGEEEEIKKVNKKKENSKKKKKERKKDEKPNMQCSCCFQCRRQNERGER